MEAPDRSLTPPRPSFFRLTGAQAEHLQSISLLVILSSLFFVLAGVSTLALSKRRSTTTVLRSLRPNAPLSVMATSGAYEFLATACYLSALQHVA